MSSNPEPSQPARSVPGGDVSATVTWHAPTDGEPPRTFEVPRQLGNLRLGDEIGRGGMGVVVQAWDEVLRRAVAVKFLLGAVPTEGDPHFEQFLLGARAEAAVRHANIVPVHAAGLVSDLPYVVMDLIDGPTLRKLVSEAGRLPRSAALRTMASTASAVAALHTGGFIHRDLKPANVLFDRAGQLFVTDFGLTALQQHSRSGLAKAGTPIYMAPEAFEGQALPQTDVYALGVMLFELLTGVPPFLGDREELHRLHREAEPDLGSLDAIGHGDLGEVVQRALHKREVFRYKTASHFLRALELAGAEPAGLREGETELQTLIARVLARQRGFDRPDCTGDTPAGTYFDRLAQIADEKRTRRSNSDSDTPLPPEETLVTARPRPSGPPAEDAGVTETGPAPEAPARRTEPSSAADEQHPPRSVIARTRQGLALLSAGAMGAGVLVLATALEPPMALLPGDGYRPASPAQGVALTLAGLLALTLAAGLAGAWLVTTRAGLRRQEPLAALPRLVARALTGIGTAALVAATVTLWPAEAAPAAATGMPRLALVLSMAGTLLWSAGGVLTLLGVGRDLAAGPVGQHAPVQHTPAAGVAVAGVATATGLLMLGGGQLDAHRLACILGALAWSAVAITLVSWRHMLRSPHHAQ